MTARKPTGSFKARRKFLFEQQNPMMTDQPTGRNARRLAKKEANKK